MSLEGALAERGLAELMQQVASQHRTGLLELSGMATPDLQVSFLSGRAVRLEYASRPADTFGQRLVAAGALEPRQLRAALKVQRASPQTPLGEVLMAQGSIERETRDHFLRLQVRERLGALFEQTSGRFKFVPKPPNFTKPATNPIPAELILQEGIRRADEWPLIRTRVRSNQAVFRVVKRADAVEDDAAAALARALDEAFTEALDEEGGVGPDGKRQLSRSERKVLELVDGKRTVAEVARLGWLGTFDTCKAVYNLNQSGHLELAKAGRVGAAEGGGRGRDLALRVLLNLLVLGALGATCWWLWGSRSAVQDNAAELGHTVGERLRVNRIDAIATALEIHRLTHGVYPDALEVLVEMGLVAPFVLEPIDGQPWNYVGVGLDYDLR